MEIWAIGADGGDENRTRVMLADAVVKAAGSYVLGEISVQHRAGAAGAMCSVRIEGKASEFNENNPGFGTPAEDFFDAP